MPKKPIDVENLDEVVQYTKDIEKSKDNKSVDYWDILSKFRSCFSQMKADRNKHEEERDIDDGQMEANTYYDENWVLQVNPPMEQSLVELAMGRMAGKMNYTLEAIGNKPIAEDLVVAKHTLAHYIRSERMHEEIKRGRYTGWVYWTTVRYTGVIAETEMFYDPKEWDWQEAIRTTEYVERKETSYKFTGCNVPLRAFRLSWDWLNSPDIQKASKAVRKESMSIEKFKIKFGDDIFKNTSQVNPSVDESPDYGEQKPISVDEVQVFYYYDQTTKDFWIVANETEVIFVGKYTNKTWWLPFRSKQHYTDYKSFYGKGICSKVRYLKAYKAEMLQDLLAQSKMWWPNIIAWNNNTLSSEYLNNPWEVGIRQFSGDIQNIRTFQYSPDIQKYASILSIIDELVVQDTGENLKATYQALAPQLGTVEIIENARATRLANVDENDDLFLGQILTCSLDNVTQYAPKLQTKTETHKDGSQTVEYPMIHVKDFRAEENEDWTVTLIEDMGEQWYFEFREEMIKGRYLVKVVTNSNVNTQKTLEKNSLTQMINNLSTIAQFAPDLIQQEDMKGILSVMKQLNGFDEKYDVDTTRDKLKREAEDLLNKIQWSLWLTQFNDPNAPQTPQTAVPWWDTMPPGWGAMPPGWSNEIIQGALGNAGETPDMWATLKWELAWL
jgi:hypothetical protein